MSSILDALSSLGFNWQIALANLVNFLLIFYILKRFFFASLKTSLDDRKTKIEQGIKDAEDAKKSLQGALEEKKTILKEASLKSDEILSSAEQSAKTLELSLVKKAENEAQKIIKDAEEKKQKILQEGEKELEDKIPLLASAVIEKVLGQKMSQTENEQFIKSTLSS